jgi:hypothetical protein
MPFEVTVFDTRVSRKYPGATPRIGTGSKLVVCDQSTDIGKMVRDVVMLAKTYGHISSLRLMSHAWTSGTRGGFGLELCGDDLTPDNVEVLAPWSKLADRIYIYGCRIADSPAKGDPTRRILSDGSAEPWPNGGAFLSKIARVTGTEVVASNASQTYDVSRSTPFSNWELDPGNWEGVVKIFYPDGKSRLFDPPKDGD